MAHKMLSTGCAKNDKFEYTYSSNTAFYDNTLRNTPRSVIFSEKLTFIFQWLLQQHLVVSYNTTIFIMLWKYQNIV